MPHTQTRQNPNHIEALKAKHAALSREIDVLQNRPAADDSDIRKRKLEKLRIKEELEGLREQGAAHH